MTPVAFDRAAAAALVDVVSGVLALPIDPVYREGVTEHVLRILTVAALVTEFPVPEEVEVAPVFHP
ncbi:MAG: DUF4089 domain-containing protein [Candidatus Rokuibacteriota bacterium]